MELNQLVTALLTTTICTCSLLVSANTTLPTEFAEALPGKIAFNPKESDGYYWVQLRAFKSLPSNKADIDQLVNTISILHKDQEELNRLLIGPVSSYDEAISLRNHAIDKGISDAFVRFTDRPKSIASSKRATLAIEEKAPPQNTIVEPSNHEILKENLSTTEDVRLTDGNPRITEHSSFRLSIGSGKSKIDDQRVSYYGEWEPPLGAVGSFPAFSNWNGFVAGYDGELSVDNNNLEIAWIKDNSEYVFSYSYSQGKGGQSKFRPSENDTNFLFFGSDFNGSNIQNTTVITEDIIEHKYKNNSLDIYKRSNYSASISYDFGLSIDNKESKVEHKITQYSGTNYPNGLDFQNQEITNQYIGIIGGINYKKQLFRDISIGVDTKAYLYSLDSELVGEQRFMGFEDHETSDSKVTFRGVLEPYAKYKINENLIVKLALNYEYINDYGSIKNANCYRLLSGFIPDSCYDEAKIVFNTMENYGADLSIIYEH